MNMLKDLKENMNIINKILKKNHMELLDIKNIIYKVKQQQNEINNRLHTTEENSSEFENMAI